MNEGFLLCPTQSSWRERGTTETLWCAILLFGANRPPNTIDPPSAENLTRVFIEDVVNLPPCVSFNHCSAASSSEYSCPRRQLPPNPSFTCWCPGSPSRNSRQNFPT